MSPRDVLGGVASVVLTVLTTSVPCVAVSAPGEKSPVEWRFGLSLGWNGWRPSGDVSDVGFESDAVVFTAVGSDPIITGPSFELPKATNDQWVEIDLDCSAAGRGELFYTNKTTGQYGGFEPGWMSTVLVPGSGRQTIVVWPFWGELERMVRLRFDPPSGIRCRLHAIRIREMAGDLPAPDWDFRKGAGSWRPLYAATVKESSDGLQVIAHGMQAVVISSVRPFDAARRSVLRLDVACPGEDVIGLHWATQEEPGLYGEAIHLRDPGHSGPIELDLRQFLGWTGTVTHLAISFGNSPTATLSLCKLVIEENDVSKPFARLRHLVFARPVNRAGSQATLRAVLEHAGGPAVPPGTAVFRVNERGQVAAEPIAFKGIEPGERHELTQAILLKSAGDLVIELTVNGQRFTRTLRIDEPVIDARRLERPVDGYDVPEPQAVRTGYDIGVYYFPGWSPDQLVRWRKQADFPERDSLLGWYAEGSPKVADWHIKWAVENGLTFFLYDWYWREGKEELSAGLNAGFLKARYNDRMKFALMWANHAPYDGHTPEQLLAVTDYWIEHYFRRPNYLTVEGKPYVSFFAGSRVITQLGSAEKTRAVFEAMRARVRNAGLPGLHIGACAGPDASVLEPHRRAGYDSVTGYNYAEVGGSTLQFAYRSHVLAHEEVWKAMAAAEGAAYIPLLTVGWDDRPWAGPRSRQRFARGTQDLKDALGRLKTHLDTTGKKMALLEAWNEWGEGSYIEPNAQFGFRDIEAIRETFAPGGPWPANVAPQDVGLDAPYDLRRHP
ncbi:MAG: glycoside hydrolase family 99-like domain-containing protein [Phycisphaerae bacterium]|nr:glycoside hydrolase family 99-like domain-containing protein [Phycisphaerae bacterium]